MSSRIGQPQTFWSQSELDTLRHRLADGYSAQQIQHELPGRTVEAIKTKARLVAGNTGKYFAPVRPKAHVQVRLKQLVETTVVAAGERKVDRALIEQYRKGLLSMLATVHGVNTRSGGVPALRKLPGS